jgi:hypothetical protein
MHNPYPYFSQAKGYGTDASGGEFGRIPRPFVRVIAVEWTGLLGFLPALECLHRSLNVRAEAFVEENFLTCRFGCRTSGHPGQAIMPLPCAGVGEEFQKGGCLTERWDDSFVQVCCDQACFLRGSGVV